MGCRVGREVGRRMLRIHGEYSQRKGRMLMVASFSDDAEQICWAVLVYGLYMATNKRRRSAIAGHGVEHAIQEVMQHCRQTAEGHAQTTSCLNRLWVDR